MSLGIWCLSPCQEHQSPGALSVACSLLTADVRSSIASFLAVLYHKLYLLISLIDK